MAEIKIITTITIKKITDQGEQFFFFRQNNQDQKCVFF